MPTDRSDASVREDEYHVKQVHSGRHQEGQHARREEDEMFGRMHRQACIRMRTVHVRARVCVC